MTGLTLQGQRNELASKLSIAAQVVQEAADRLENPVVDLSAREVCVAIDTVDRLGTQLLFLQGQTGAYPKETQ